MLVNLISSIAAEIQGDHFLPHKPRWDVRGCSLVLGSYYDGYEHENHVVKDTVGSTSWSDEFRFDKTNLVLSSTYFRVPEENIDFESLSKEWLEVSPLTGLLSLPESVYFEPEPSSFRWFDPEGQFLICINENALSKTHNRLRLRIAIDVDLMFANNQFCGWILSNPLNYVTKSWEDPQPLVMDSNLVSISHKYLHLVSEDFLEKMENEDSRVLQDLLSLKHDSNKLENIGYQRKVFSECIESIINQFYGNLVV